MTYRGNFFSLPNEIFLLKLRPGELAVYCYLRRCENQKTHQCWPSCKTIGSAVGMCENTVGKYVQLLAERGLIAVEPTTVTTRSGAARNGTLRFTLLPPQDAVRRHYRQVLESMERNTERQRVQELLRKRKQSGSCDGL